MIKEKDWNNLEKMIDCERERERKGEKSKDRKRNGKGKEMERNNFRSATKLNIQFQDYTA